MVMTLIPSFNIRSRGRRCGLCDSFEPDTLDHIVARCDVTALSIRELQKKKKLITMKGVEMTEIIIQCVRTI